jgi:hypothetical protein
MINLISKRKRLLLTLLISGGVFVIFFSQALAVEELDSNQKFFLDANYDSTARAEITATLKKISTNAYFYIEDDYWDSLTAAQKTSYLENVDKLANEFDETIYPSLTYFYGSEWNPGIDEDSRMTILLTKLKSNAGGYFNEKDERNPLQEPTSNSREMIYLSSVQITNPLIYGLLAHEMQHLISWNQKERIRGIRDEVWLNELRSEYAPTVCGYDSDYVGSNLERRVEDFLANPFDSLTEWRGEKFDYPSVNILGHYLAEQYGEEIIGMTVKNNKAGIASVEQALTDKGYNVSFSKLFNQWTIASYLNDKLLYGGIYGYKNPYLKGNLFVSPISYSIVSANVINISQDIKDWAPHWYRFINRQDSSTITKDLEIEFEGVVDGSNFSVFYIIDYLNQAKDPIVGNLNLTSQHGVIKIPDFKNTFDSITIIVSNQFKRFGFTNNELASPFSLSVATTLFQEHVDLPTSTEFAKPEDYGLKEGDLIRAEGDFDIFIINNYGYKRLFLNPVIFNMYGHLGGWTAVKTVKLTTRDAFKTSNYYRYSESPKVYEVEVTGGDIGKLHWLNMTGEQFLAGARPESVFTINKSELNWYPLDTEKTSL